MKPSSFKDALRAAARFYQVPTYSEGDGLGYLPFVMMLAGTISVAAGLWRILSLLGQR